MKLSIRWKLILAIGLPLLIVYPTVLTVQYFKVKKVAYEQMKDYLAEHVSRYVEELNGEFSTTAQVAKSTADFLSTSIRPTAPELFEMLKENVGQHPMIYGSAIAFAPSAFNSKRKLFSPYVWKDLNQEGKPLQSMDIGTEAYDYTKTEWFSKPKELGRGVWTEPYFDEGAGNILMTTYSAPFYKNGKFYGVATVDIDIEDLQKWWKQTRYESGSYSIYTKDGKFVSHSDPNLIMKESLFSIAAKKNRSDLVEFGEKAVSGEKGVIRLKDYPFDKTSFVFYAPISSTDWIFGAAVPEAEVMSEVWKSLASFVSVMALIFVLIVAILFIASFLITNPIRRLSSEAKKIADGCFECDVTLPNPAQHLQCDVSSGYSKDEIGQFARSFHEMVVKLRQFIKALTEAAAKREAVESELRVARQIQASLLPHDFPAFPDRTEFDLYALNTPARYVAGDFYDFYFAGEDELVMVLGDVAGKGVPASLFMVILHTLLHSLVKTAEGPAQMMAELNLETLKENEQNLFVTMIIAFYNVKTGRLRYANGGHPSAYILDSSDKVRELGRATGPIVGVFDDVRFDERETTLLPGETVIFYTDGIPEARNSDSEFFGDERFKKLLLSQKEKPLKDFSEVVFREVNQFQHGELSDDVTLMALRRNASK